MKRLPPQRTFFCKKLLQIGYSSMCLLVTELQGPAAESVIKQAYESGQVCEGDWGEVTLCIDGQIKKVQMAIFTAAHSHYRYSRVFVRQDIASFQQSHA